MSGDLKERIEKMLAGLGATPDAVAETLAGRNITGFTGDCHFCPVATLLVDEFGPDWKVEDYSVTDTLVKFPGGELFTPQAVTEFIERFDSHEYPHLIDIDDLEEGAER